MVHDLHTMVDAIGYVTRYGIEWRALPVDFPPREAVHAVSCVDRGIVCPNGCPNACPNGLPGGWPGAPRTAAHPGRTGETTDGRVHRLPDGPGSRDRRRGGLLLRRGQAPQGGEAARRGDTLGLLLGVTVTAVSVQDRDGHRRVGARP
ncbi:transposase [Nonomuraea rubra]